MSHINSFIYVHINTIFINLGDEEAPLPITSITIPKSDNGKTVIASVGTGDVVFVSKSIIKVRTII